MRISIQYNDAPAPPVRVPFRVSYETRDLKGCGDRIMGVVWTAPDGSTRFGAHTGDPSSTPITESQYRLFKSVRDMPARTALAEMDGDMYTIRRLH